MLEFGFSYLLSHVILTCLAVRNFIYNMSIECLQGLKGQQILAHVVGVTDGRTRQHFIYIEENVSVPKILK